MPLSGSSPLTIVCLASYFKGGDFIRECHENGAHVILVVKEKLQDEEWPFDCIDQLVAVPNNATPELFVHTVTELARDHRLDRIVALEEYDVLNAALIREHLRIPGMGTTTARFFRDKLAMRVKAQFANVRVPDFVHVLNRGEIKGFMTYVPPPWVLKPRSDVSAVGIQKLSDPELVWRAIEALDARPVLTERSSYYLLERFVPGNVFHVDSLVEDREIVFASANRYWRPPMEVAHHGGVFVTCTVQHGSEDEKALLSLNEAVIKALSMVRGATHAEFIKAESGEFYFLEIAARVGGAYIADMAEAATGINVWREWARLELIRGERPYALAPSRTDYAGVALSLARQEWPDTSAYDDPEIAQRVRKRHHVGLIVRSPGYERVQTLLGNYVQRFNEDFLAVLPPLAKPE